jgi:hypothetical protein
MGGVGEFAFGLVSKLIANLVQRGIDYQTLPFFQKRKIESRIDSAVADILEPLLPFLSQEGVSETQQSLLIQTCVEELKPITEDPKPLFQGSLNGQKIFDAIYANRNLPRVIIDEDLKEVYTLLFPRIATLIAKIPAAVKDWENEAWAENYRRLDELTNELQALFSKVDKLVTSPSQEADEMLSIVRRTMAQTIGLNLDITGLRADRPMACKFDDLFIHPVLIEIINDNINPKRIDNENDSFQFFSNTGSDSVIIGSPGAGKSTWAKWLQRQALSAGWAGLGIRVELRGLSDRELPSLQELIRDAAGKHLAEDITTQVVDKWLHRNLIIFIFDGFDEIRPVDRDEIVNWMISLKSKAENCPVIVTSRPLTTNHLDLLSDKLLKWNMDDFDEERIVNYIERWHRYMPLLANTNREVNAENLANAWLSDPTIAPLTGNPLLLSTLLMVHHLDGQLPSGRSQLYKRYVDGMLGLWDDRRNIPVSAIQLSPDQKRQIIRGLALKMFLSMQDQVDEAATLDLVQSLLERMRLSLPTEDVLSTLRERTGLIVGPGIYSFIHKTVAEFLVAEAIVQGDQRDEFGHRIDRFNLFKHRNDDRWNTVIFLWAGLAPIADVEAFIGECIEVKSYDLAFGIIYDQFNHIPPETISESVSRFANDAECPEMLISEGFGWVVSQGRDDNFYCDLYIPTFGLRGLSGNEHFHRFIERSIREDILDSDTLRTSSHQLLQDLVWMCQISSEDDISKWRTVLKSHRPSEGDWPIWLMWAAEGILRRVFYGMNSFSITEIVNSFYEDHQEASALIPIALISMLVSEGKYNIDEMKVLSEKIDETIVVLPNCRKINIDPVILKSTRDWLIGFDIKIGDLLIVAYEFIEEQSKTEGHLPVEAYKEALNYIEELLNIRDIES